MLMSEQQEKLWYNFTYIYLEGSEFMSDLEKIKLVKPPFPKLRCFSFKPIII